MPNWCSTQIQFVGNSEDITDFHHKIIEYTSKEFDTSGFGNNWLGNVLHGFGFGDRIDSEKFRIKCRGSISNIGDIRPCSNNNLIFSVWTETAWCPVIKMWNEIIEKHYDCRIEAYWIAEELGCGIYETNDIDWFGDDLYRIECNLEFNERNVILYCDTPNEVVEVINSLIEKYNLETNLIEEADINLAYDNNKDIYISGEDWNISCLILREVNDVDMD